jgi:GT2 family glycosyltransferase
MPTYNGERYINAALESVRGAKDEGIELVIVDDGSSDRTLEIIHDYAKLLPIRMITSGRTGNWVAATNLGLREATGDWACFLGMRWRAPKARSYYTMRYLWGTMDRRSARGIARFRRGECPPVNLSSAF